MPRPSSRRCATTRAHAIRAVFAVHTDTASSVTSDLGRAAPRHRRRRHPALLVADVVASLGAAPFEMDALGVDVAVGASQKGLMCPPGVGFVAVDAAAFAAAERNPAPRFYWDACAARTDLSYRKFCGTPPQNLLLGLEAALGLIFAEGLDAVLARHAQHRARRARRGGGLARRRRAATSSRSDAGEPIGLGDDDRACAPGIDVDALRSVARERFQVAIAGGLGPLAGRAFRIGHLGDSNPAMMLGAIAGVEAALVAQGIPVGDGGTRRAVLSLAGG